MTEESGSAEAQDCEQVLERVYEFIDNELEEATSDEIRQHLADCEPCLEHVDVEVAVKTLVQRCCGADVAPDHLRARIVMQLRYKTPL